MANGDSLVTGTALSEISTSSIATSSIATSSIATSESSASESSTSTSTSSDSSAKSTSHSSTSATAASISAASPDACSRAASSLDASGSISTIDPSPDTSDTPSRSTASASASTHASSRAAITSAQATATATPPAASAPATTPSPLDCVSGAPCVAPCVAPRVVPSGAPSGLRTGRREVSVVGANITPMNTRNAPVASTQRRRGPVASRESSVSGYGTISGTGTSTLASIHCGTVSSALPISSSGRSPFGILFSCARTSRSSSRGSSRSMSARNCWYASNCSCARVSFACWMLRFCSSSCRSRCAGISTAETMSARPAMTNGHPGSKRKSGVGVDIEVAPATAGRSPTCVTSPAASRLAPSLCV